VPSAVKNRRSPNLPAALTSVGVTSGSRSIAELFQALLQLSRSLNEEQTRHVRENLSELELTIFDLLTRPDPALTEEERIVVKKVPRQLFERLKDGLTLDRRGKASARASVLTAIKGTLDDDLPRAYTPEIYARKCASLFEHVYEVTVA
jgi:type I restriction enzyme R subunit